ncbi:carbohydrate ABC transporter permease [Paenibacillus thiaminolyticus]|nr:carbohydrate ABC transporter permease [Paenibacillus thiaminolyticus]MCY9539052.1 carbohydrate ABC transporter permease [Paenibacillus thiaminolyticus]MCY9605154.1 carbohydrate ABC transporter permease [Paenibacillus thiaminolyticus]MCY9607159.1 carbohydrate ABC transporter permease [Paenibacillus thiaminolyticus]MCY9616284.1 carbohydrate ABC transporter permease [Paenibacillus thiaminolyticus]MCY9620063.1 carbohydrate ABC transporter permease [Paenibacillus thiaminolyticus]
MKHKKLRRNILLYFFLALFSLTTLFPLLWMITTSLKSGDIIFEMPPRLWPDGLHWENYTRAIEEINFLVLFKNTAIITFLQLLSNVFVSAFVAYGFARFDFRWKNFWFMLMLSTIMIPGEVTLIPVFIAFSELGWSNSIKPLVIPGFFGGAPVFIFLLRQFFLSIPKELEESAVVDGAGSFKIFYKIFIPLSVPALITIGIFSFQGSWNDLMGPLIYLNDTDKFTLTLGLSMFKGMMKVEWGPLMAGSILALLPVLAVFFVAQKHFVEGVKLSGIKG